MKRLAGMVCLVAFAYVLFWVGREHREQEAQDYGTMPMLGGMGEVPDVTPTPTSTPIATPPGVSAPADWSGAFRGWWSLDETSGNRVAYTGTVCQTGGSDCDLVPSSGSLGRVSSAPEGAGAADFASAQQHKLSCVGSTCNELDIPSGGSATYGGWFRSSVNNLHILGKGGQTATDAGYNIGLNWFWASDAICAVSNGTARSAAGIPLTTRAHGEGIWHHFACRAQHASTGVKGCGDGTCDAISTGGSMGIGPNPDEDFSLAIASGGSTYMNGQIDEVFVTDRVLTVQQVCRICACGIDGKRCSCSAEVNHETEYAACNSNADCIPPYGICDPTSDKCTGWQHPQQVVCWGGSNAGNLCTVGSECPGGTCYGAPTCGGCTLPDCNAPTPAPQPTATETATATPTATVTPNSTPTVTVTPNPTSTASPSPALDWVSGAVAVWRFEADLTDETGDSNNTLTYDSTPTPAPGRTPNWTGPVQQGSYSIGFTKTLNEFLGCDLATCTDANRPDHTSFTVGCFVRRPDLSQDAFLMDTFSGGTNGGYRMKLRSATGDPLTCYLYNGSTLSTTNGTSEIANNTYTAVACVNDEGGGTLTAYTDGHAIPTGGTASSGYTARASGTFQISSSTATSDMDGYLDECYIYPKALSSAQTCRVARCGLDGALCACNGADTTLYTPCATNADCRVGSFAPAAVCSWGRCAGRQRGVCGCPLLADPFAAACTYNDAFQSCATDSDCTDGGYSTKYCVNGTNDGTGCYGDGNCTGGGKCWGAATCIPCTPSNCNAGAP